MNLESLSAINGMRRQAIRMPLKDVETGIKNLLPELAGYRILQLSNLHISRLFDASLDAGFGPACQQAGRFRLIQA